ncbi:uncharacterized protein LOC124395397 [Silurus meridionalis]|uniref:uncharacterized protein LOC124395397 n=1 Tax=Silurus meridionalis TaxID=175797 RepID=UPI001EEA129D|nr:uncharacterized protein LOC124395397 [Silurus meridionalis]
MVQARVVFNSFTPVPSESLALSAITSLLSSRFTNLTDTLKVLNVTYQRISNTSYALIFEISLSNISIPENPEIWNDTYTQVENAINNVLNTLLNAPGADLFAAISSNFMSLDNLLEGDMEYSFQAGDSYIPISFLSQLSLITGSAVVQAKLMFNSSFLALSENLVFSAITYLLNTRIRNFGDTVNVLNFTYENSSDTSCAIIFTISISGIHMPENPDLRNDTYNQVASIINNVLNLILAEPMNSSLHPQEAEFMSIFNLSVGKMLYSFQEENITKLTNFINLLNAYGMAANISAASTSPPSLMGTVLIYIRLVFKNLTNVPSQADVIKAANALLDSSVRLARDTETVKVFNPVSIQDVTYQKLGNNSYIIGFGFAIMNVSIALNTDLRNDTYDLIQNTINGLLNRILNSPNSKPFIFPRANYMGNSTMIVADSEYVFSQGGSDGLRFEPSGFLAQILIVSGLSDPPSPTLAPITIVTEFLPISVEGGLPEWALAIIIPCTVAIILIPCWILICCLLCGCCAALRRRYSRRRSYNVQYTTRNGLF